MKESYKYLLLIFPLTLQSCIQGGNLFDVAIGAHNSIKEKNAVKRVVKQFDTTDFNLFKGKSITSYYRGIDVPYGLEIDNATHYIMYPDISKTVLYVVLFDEGKDSVLRVIKNRKDATAQVNLSEIQTLIREFRKLNIVRLEVDHTGNAYIYPLYYYEPIILKKADSSAPIDSTKFKPYKKSWYVRFRESKLNRHQ